MDPSGLRGSVGLALFCPSTCANMKFWFPIYTFFSGTPCGWSIENFFMASSTTRAHRSIVVWQTRPIRIMCPQIHCYMEQLNNRGVILCSIFLDGNEAEKLWCWFLCSFLSLHFDGHFSSRVHSWPNLSSKIPSGVPLQKSNPGLIISPTSVTE